MVLAQEGRGFGYSLTLRALLEAHHHYSAVESGADDLELVEVHMGLAHMLSASMLSTESFAAALPIWAVVDPANKSSPIASPPAALAATAAYLAATMMSGAPDYLKRRDAKKTSPADASNERIVMAMVRLFVASPERLTGFQSLVPSVFGSYLSRGCALRTKLCDILASGGMDDTVVERIRNDDELVSQTFFWSGPGMKLFGEHPDLHDEAKLTSLLRDAINQQPAILLAFLTQVAAKADATPPTATSGLGLTLKTAVVALSTHVATVSK